MTLEYSTLIKYRNSRENLEIINWCMREFGGRHTRDYRDGEWDCRWAGMDVSEQERDKHASLFRWSFKTEEQLTLFILRWA